MTSIATFTSAMPHVAHWLQELQEGSFATLIDNEFLELYGPAGTRVKVKELGEDGLVHVAIVDSDRSAWIPKEYLKAGRGLQWLRGCQEGQGSKCRPSRLPTRSCRTCYRQVT